MTAARVFVYVLLLQTTKISKEIEREREKRIKEKTLIQKEKKCSIQLWKITENDSAFLISRRVNSHTYIFDIHLLWPASQPVSQPRARETAREWERESERQSASDQDTHREREKEKKKRDYSSIGYSDTTIQYTLTTLYCPEHSHHIRERKREISYTVCCYFSPDFFLSSFHRFLHKCATIVWNWNNNNYYDHNNNNNNMKKEEKKRA